MADALDVVFSGDLDEGRSCILLELAPEIESLLSDPKNRDKRIFLKGRENDRATLCTEECTFLVKIVGMSNTLLFSRLKENSLDVTANLNSYLELTRIVPDPSELKKLFLTIPEYSGQTPSGGKPFSELSLNVQASDKELREMLSDVNGICIDDMWFLVNKNYAERTLKYLLASVYSRFSCLDNIPISSAREILSEYEVRKEMQDWILAVFCNAQNQNFSISRSEVVRFTGICILESHRNKSLLLSDFLSLWNKSIGRYFEIDLDIIKEFCFIYEETKTDYGCEIRMEKIQYYPKSELPLDAQERLKALFQTRCKWPASSFMNFVQDLAPDKKSLEVLLLKYTRVFDVGGKTFYSSKYPLLC